MLRLIAARGCDTKKIPSETRQGLRFAGLFVHFKSPDVRKPKEYLVFRLSLSNDLFIVKEFENVKIITKLKKLGDHKSNCQD